jgi:hypothetical protein
MGIVSDEGEALKLLGYPDLKSFMARKNAPRDLLDRNIESIVVKGKWKAPEPLDDHELALVEVPLALAQARNKGVEPERITMLRRYVVLSARLQKLKMAGQIDGAVADPSMGGDPSADPNAPPPDPKRTAARHGAPPPGGPMPPSAPHGDGRMSLTAEQSAALAADDADRQRRRPDPRRHARVRRAADRSARRGRSPRPRATNEAERPKAGGREARSREDSGAATRMARRRSSRNASRSRSPRPAKGSSATRSASSNTKSVSTRTSNSGRAR